MLLIVTNRADPHADEVIRRLHANNIAVFRLNTEGITSDYQISLNVDSVGNWNGLIVDELGRELILSKLKVAWIRRPEVAFGKPIDGISRFILSEVKALLACLYSIPTITFINENFDAARAKTKFQQLIHASQAGVRVPRTIITNSPEAAAAFVKESASALIVKSVYTSNFDHEATKHGVFSRKISSKDLLEKIDLVANCPTQIQDYIDKQFELRVTVIGERAFAVKIDSQANDLTKVDWRKFTLINPHSVFELPKRISDFCVEFIRGQKLVYGAIDFIVDNNDDFIFLENNPSGQYLWLEELTGVDITGELVRLVADIVVCG